MASTVPQVPASLRQIQHYMKTAAEHDKRDVAVAYYCRLYALQKAMEIDKKSPEARQFLVSLMDYLEKVKKEHSEEAIHNEVVGQAHMENYALKVFLYADNEDRAGRFTKNVVKSFYTAGMLFDVLGTFGELSEDLVKNQKYAKWKAAYIHRCLKNGETPLPGPMLDDNEDIGIGFEDFSQPGSSSLAAPGGMFPTPGVHAPPTTPQDPPAAAYTPQPTNQPVPIPRKSPPQEIVADWQPPPNPAGVQLTALHYQKAIKLCKYASSAMQYEDAATAIENLSKALRILTTGKDV